MLAGNSSKQGCLAAGLQDAMETRFLRIQRSGFRRKLKTRSANNSVQPAISEHRAVLAYFIVQTLAGAFTSSATHFKNIGKVSAEVYPHRNGGRVGAVIEQTDLNITSGSTKELQPEDVQRSLRQSGKAVVINIGEIHREERIVFADGGAQKQRLAFVYMNGELRKVTALRMKKAKLGQPDKLDVSEPVEHGESVTGLEDSRAVVRQGGGRSNVVFVLEPNDVCQEALPYRVSEESSRGAGSAKVSAVRSNS